MDLGCDLDYCDTRSIGSGSVATSSVVSDEETEPEPAEVSIVEFTWKSKSYSFRSCEYSFPQGLEELKQKFKELATRPVLTQESQISNNRSDWETELNVAVQKLDHIMHLQEYEKELLDKK